jgi:Arc/MetJ-type ribon-helix-helix transcriptional regulator
MASGMATKKVTITLDADQLSAIRALVEAGSASSVSAFVQHAVAVSLNDVAGWGALLAAALEKTGGPITREERSWADGVLLKPPGKRKTRARAA